MEELSAVTGLEDVCRETNDCRCSYCARLLEQVALNSSAVCGDARPTQLIIIEDEPTSEMCEVVANEAGSPMDIVQALDSAQSTICSVTSPATENCLTGSTKMLETLMAKLTTSSHVQKLSKRHGTCAAYRIAGKRSPIDFVYQEEDPKGIVPMLLLTRGAVVKSLDHSKSFIVVAIIQYKMSFLAKVLELIEGEADILQFQYLDICTIIQPLEDFRVEYVDTLDLSETEICDLYEGIAPPKKKKTNAPKASKKSKSPPVKRNKSLSEIMDAAEFTPKSVAPKKAKATRKLPERTPKRAKSMPKVLDTDAFPAEIDDPISFAVSDPPIVSKPLRVPARMEQQINVTPPSVPVIEIVAESVSQPSQHLGQALIPSVPVVDPMDSLRPFSVPVAPQAVSALHFASILQQQLMSQQQQQFMLQQQQQNFAQQQQQQMMQHQFLMQQQQQNFSQQQQLNFQQQQALLQQQILAPAQFSHWKI